MNKLFTRWLPCLTLAIWSGVLLAIYFSGRVNDFLTPFFRPGVLAAGIVLGLMALAFLLFPADASCCSSAECGHSLSRLNSGKILTFLILLLPISAAAMFSPAGYSANMVKNRGVITDVTQLGLGKRSGPLTAPDLPLPSKDPAPEVASTDTGSTPPASPTTAPNASSLPPAPNTTPAPAEQSVTSDYLQKTPDGLIVAEVLDLLYAAQDTALRKDFEGKSVQLIGQLMPDASNNPKGNRFKAVRMFMTCCAADARPVATLVEAAVPPGMAEMSWIKISGTATFPIENGRRVAVLKADKVEATSPPEESMLY